jgi:hypothetical protein
MRPRLTDRVLTLTLVAVLLATGSGWPSHDHRGDDLGPVLMDAGHHSHGVLVMDAVMRLASPNILAVVPGRVVELVWIHANVAQPVSGVLDVRPRERAPPPSRPRAPPHLA